MVPTLFISHGAPSLAQEGGPTADFLRGLGRDLGTPSAVLCASAHWQTAAPTISTATAPETLHDFSGFGPDLEHLRYPAPGAPEVAQRALALLHAAGFAEAGAAQRGLDHGAWVPLSLMYPAATVPVTQIALQPGRGPAHHLALGRALAPLRAEGVLVIGSGGATHNLGELSALTVLPGWAAEFDRWLVEAVLAGRSDDLLRYRILAPHASRNHPSEEHLLPLLVALGAAGPGCVARRLHQGSTWGSLSMTAFAFDAV